MCGIAGTVCLSEECELDHRAVVSHMCDVIHHRGPDDEGVARLNGACLGSKRLAILDLSEAGRMPMTSPDGRWTLTYNGEIYNFREIRSELVEAGHRFFSGSDTEVLLHAWMEWGEECYERLVGMFAFAIHDADEQTVTLVRDRYGIKPLYYAIRADHLYFASETKAISAIHGATMDGHALLEWSLYRNVDALTAGTLFSEVSSVLPGERVLIEDGELERRALHVQPDEVSEKEYGRYLKAPTLEVAEELTELLNDAVEARLVADVPVGTLLSGGLDSSLVTAIAARRHGRFKAFHVSVPGYARMDESRYAERVASHLGIDLVKHEFTAEEFRRELPRVIYHSDMPITHPNTVAYYAIARVAREHGVTVLQSGEGADELFGGYRWAYRRRRLLLRINPLLELLPQKVRNILALVTYSMVGLPTTSWRFRELLPQSVDLVDRYTRRAWLARCEEAYEFVEKPLDRAILGAILADLNDFLAPLLRRLDRTTMAHSVECRVPFLDHRLVHMAKQLPVSYRLGARADKWILKRVAHPHLPKEIIERPKRGFPLPVAEFIEPLLTEELFLEGYLRRELGIHWLGISSQLERGRRGEVDAFGFLTLELWGRIFVRGESVEELTDRLAGAAA